MKISAFNGSSNSLLQHKKLPDDRLAEKCQEFEAVFLQKLLEVCQPKNSLFGSGMQGDFYQGFYLEELAKEISKNPGIGIAENMYRALKTGQESEHQE